jgi:hypothetical protein
MFIKHVRFHGVPPLGGLDRMGDDCGNAPLIAGHFGRISAVGVVFVLAAFLTTGFAPTAGALPSFARRTGQPCGTFHTDFPALTPFGRRFKLLGYTVGGGKFRTTPFPASDDAKAAADKLRNFAKGMDSGTDGSTDKAWVLPIAMMAIAGYTHTQAPLPPPAAPYGPNDNTVLSPFSGFWGGAITEHIGAFAQVTYNAPGPGGFPDPFGHTWTWDNTDVRYAKAMTVGNLDIIFGITANNNPSVQDVWNRATSASLGFIRSSTIWRAKCRKRLPRKPPATAERRRNS